MRFRRARRSVLAAGLLGSLVACSDQGATGHPAFSSPSHADSGPTGQAGSSGGAAGGLGGSPSEAGPEPDAARTDSAAIFDAAGVDASLGNDGAGSQRHAALIWGYGEHLPTPSPSDPLMPLDVTMKARLEAKGLIVDTLVDKLSTVDQVAGKALMVISNSVDRRNLLDDGKARFRDVRVPAILMKDGVIEGMGMGSGSSGGYSTPVGQTQIAIVAPEDPLAAGLRGNVTVYTSMGGASCPPCYLKYLQTSDRLIYAFPSPSAKVIATIIGKSDEAAIFAYAVGATMIDGFIAPAKRMGFFIHRDTDYSPDGIKLFDAALDYLLRQ